MTDFREGRMGYKIYFKSFGDPSSKQKILCLHGGPGLTHDYMLPLAELSEHGYEVIFYDQLGCGKSEVPKNPALFSIEQDLEDLESLRESMNLGKIHLIGSSYGGLLALAYALKYQKHIKSIVTIGGLHSVPLATKEIEKMKRSLTNKVLETMEEYEDRGEYFHPTYLDAVNVFYKLHFCRLKHWPKELVYSLKHSNPAVYMVTNGPNEFVNIGNHRYFDISKEIHTIKVPTLVTCGRYDEVSPKIARSIHHSIKNSRIVVFKNSSHLPMWEERARFVKVVKNFLDSLSSV